MPTSEISSPRPFNGIDPACYAYLFGHQGVEIERIGEYLDPAGFSLAGLYRQTTPRGKNRRDTQGRKDNIAEQVTKTLASYDVSAQGEGSSANETETLYGFQSNQGRDLTAQVVSGVLARWDLALQRQKNPQGGVLDTKFGVRPVVLETTMAILRLGGFSLQSGASGREILTAKVSYYGPGYIEAWMDGTLIRNWAQAEGMDAQSQAEWLAVCGPARRRQALRAADPVYFMRHARKRFEALSTERVQATLGWSDEEMKLLQPYVRNEVAFRQYGGLGPYESLAKLKYLMETVMTDARIAERLGWTESQVSARFYQSLRVSLALSNYTDPLEACEKAVRRGTIKLERGRPGRPPRQPAQQPVS